MNAELKEFLQGVSRKGVFESTGCFTVDVEKMRMKLRQNQFLHPTHAILSCVRAGVASGSSSIAIGLAYETTRIELRDPRTLVPRALLEGVLGGAGGADTERLLGAAFQGAFANDCQRIEVDLPDARVVLTPDVMDVQPTQAGGNVCQIRFHYGRDRAANRKRCLEEAWAVSSRAAFCPIPVVLDGIPVNEGLAWEKLLTWQQTSEEYGVHEDFVWLEALLTGDGEPFPVQASSRKFRVEFVGGDRFEAGGWEAGKGSGFVRVMPKLEGNRRRVGCLMRLGSELRGAGQLYVIRQGVVLEPIEEALGAPAIAIVLRADDLDTDLSLFQVVRNHKYEALLNSLRPRTQAVIAQFGRSNKAFVLPKKSSNALPWSLAWGAGGAGLMAPLGIWGSLLGALFTGGVAAAVHALRFGDRALVERELRVRWLLDKYVDTVGGTRTKSGGPKRHRL